ncbi:MAG TPA: nicotinate-nucleotide adenylyltransferase [Methylophilaceae bacterium]|nr:nicotinate-nucleotide adenylyltransferase [Methylophilaceae bacterium]
MIGILGGTFDPIHFGHLRLAQELTETLELSEIRFIPAAQPPHRHMPAAYASHRAAMVQLAIADNPLFSLDLRELQRDGASYTIDTLLSLRSDLGLEEPLCLLMGSDAFLGLPTWHCWHELLGLCHIVVAHRPNAPPQVSSMPSALKELWESNGVANCHDLAKSSAGCIFMQHITPLDISATRIREDLRQGHSVRYLVPDAVIEYLQTNQLYT